MCQAYAQHLEQRCEIIQIHKASANSGANLGSRENFKMGPHGIRNHRITIDRQKNLLTK